VRGVHTCKNGAHGRRFASSLVIVTRRYYKEKDERYRPEDHYTPAKHRNIVRAFSAYLQREHSGLETPHALHLVCVEIDHATHRARVRVVWDVGGV
jgi:hypothetical protein